MKLYAYRNDFNPLHQIESPESKLVQVFSVDCLELSVGAQRALSNALQVCDGIFFCNERTTAAIGLIVANDSLASREDVVSICTFLTHNAYRWVGLR